MTKKDEALQKIESHEKLCRIMQKQTHDKIHSIETQIQRIESILLITSGVLSIPLRVAVIDFVISERVKCLLSCIILFCD